MRRMEIMAFSIMGLTPEIPCCVALAVVRMTLPAVLYSKET
jgi:hypothetical protein